MAVLKVRFDNVLCFNNFEANFTYPKKLVNSPLEYEYLEEYPNIRYKKVNILIGANSSGKTSLGKAIWTTLLFMFNKEANPIKEMVSDKNKVASVLIDFAFKEGAFERFETIIYPSGEVKARCRAMEIKKDDSYESV